MGKQTNPKKTKKKTINKAPGKEGAISLCTVAHARIAIVPLNGGSVRSVCQPYRKIRIFSAADNRKTPETGFSARKTIQWPMPVVALLFALSALEAAVYAEVLQQHPCPAQPSGKNGA